MEYLAALSLLVFLTKLMINEKIYFQSKIPLLPLLSRENMGGIFVFGNNLPKVLMIFRFIHIESLS